MGLALDLLLQALLEGFTPESAMAFLRHPLVRLDKAQLEQFEVAVLRGRLVDDTGFASNLKQAQLQHAHETHAHPLLQRMTEDNWRALHGLAAQIDAIANLRLARPQLFTEQLRKIVAALESVTDAEDWDVPLRDFLQKLQDESRRLKSLSMAEAVLILRTLLQAETVAASSPSHPRLAILGTLEARLMVADVMILGSLNETIWPAQTDPGPWLNRKMRAPLNLPQPERDIGLAAHDFEQGFSQPKVYLTWSKRIGHAPAQASRWLLRLDAVLQVAKVKRDQSEAVMWLALAQSLSQPDGSEPLQGPMPKPAFAPPVEARPRRFSATEVERLIRNPYAIYARKILKLEPLPDFIAAPSPALRGTIFHEAIGDWNKQQAPGEVVLLAEGEKQFAAFGLYAALKSFWLPHFRKVAAYLAGLEEELKQGGIAIHAELSGKHEFEVDGVIHTLTARADRIDLLKGGEVRIIDYKTGKPPSPDQVEVGLNPQMTLEAALLKEGGFGAELALPPREALYVRIGRGRDALNVQSAVGDKSVGLDALAQKHFTGFKSLLRIYLDPATPYLPRLRSEKDEADEDYDHLSRYLEWQLAP
jgi:ATP-dependent helicase/nuclease subunit B